MDIKNSTASTASQLLSPQPAVVPNTQQANKQPEKQPDSTVVKLSEQAKQLQRAENQNKVEQANDTQNNKQSGTARTEQNARPPGIQFISGENKGGHIKTSA